jgi:hypothetical protein
MSGRVSRRLDILLSVAIFVAVSLAGGRIYRLPFDDEVFTLRFVGAPHAYLSHYLLMDADPTPQLSYVIYYAAMLAGSGAIGWRWLCFVIFRRCDFPNRPYLLDYLASFGIFASILTSIAKIWSATGWCC